MAKYIEDNPTRQSILEEARRCVCGDRDQQYPDGFSAERSIHREDENGL